MASINVAELTDSELRKKIKELGKDAGPITKTTRPIWEKKLAKLLAEKNEVVQEEPKKERRKSKGRVAAAPVVAPPAQKKTPTRSTAKGKKLAMFSSDEEPEEAILRSVQTSPIGFPSPTVVAKKIEIKKTSSPVQNGKSLIAPSPASSIKTTTRRRTINKIEPNDSNTNTTSIQSSFESSISSRSRRNDDKQQVLSSRSSKKLSEYSDDDFTDSGSGFKPKVYTHSNILSTNSRIKSAESETLRQQDDLLFKRPTALPSSSSVYTRSTLTKIDLNSSSKRSASPVDKALLNPPKNKTESIASEIEATLDEIRNSYKAKKPSPLTRSSRTVSHTTKPEKNYDNNEETEEENEMEDDMEDEEIDVKFAPTFGFMSKKVIFFSAFIVLLIALIAGLYYVGEKTDVKLGITQSLGNIFKFFKILFIYCFLYIL